MINTLEFYRSFMFIGDFFLALGGILLCVAFLTLLERNFLGAVNFRVGPSNIVLWGISQPIADAIKLFSKEYIKENDSSVYLFFCGPFFGLWQMCILWMGVVGLNFVWCSSYSAIYLFSIISLGVYFVLLCGWGSNSSYALFGSYRGVAQTASYEVCLILFALSVCYYSESYNVCLFFSLQEGLWFALWCFLYAVFWLIVCLAESNRSPFDFSEGESELVSGFNVEYGGMLFSLIFINEYGSLLLLGGLTSLLLLGSSFLLFKCLLVSLSFVIVRGSYPRYRYDILMGYSWKFLLPFSLTFLYIVSVLC